MMAVSVQRTLMNEWSKPGGETQTVCNSVSTGIASTQT